MYHDEESLLKWIPNCRGGIKNLLETFFYKLGHFQRMIDRSIDPCVIPVKSATHSI